MEHSFRATALLLAAAGFAALGLVSAFPGEEIPEEVPVAELPAESEPALQEMRLGIFEGKLALFFGESLYPGEIFELSVRTLPEPDRILLEEGIILHSEEELRRFLEDYMS